MGNDCKHTLAIVQEKQIMLEQINIVKKYQKKRKNRRLLIGIYGTITIAMPVATLGLAAVINLQCGVLATIGLSIPLVKAKKHVDQLKQELEKMEKNYPFISKLKKENCDELRQRTEEIFMTKIQESKAHQKEDKSSSNSHNKMLNDKLHHDMYKQTQTEAMPLYTQLQQETKIRGHAYKKTIPQRRG